LANPSVHSVRPSVDRTSTPVAWRFWPISPSNFKREMDVYDDVVEFNLNRQIAAIGYMNAPMYATPSERGSFRNATGENDIAYQFAWQMRRGDIIFICRNTWHVIAWGLLLDDGALFFDEPDPIWRELRPLRDRVWEIEGEWFCNYRRVDRWRRIDLKPDCPGGRLPGSPQWTVASYHESDITRWLGIGEDLTAVRRALPAEVRTPESYILAPAVPRTPFARGQGRVLNQGRRDAVELHAMKLAACYYRKRGYHVSDVSAREPYDLECSRGDIVRCVEVKGGTLGASTVCLTRREVGNAREYETDLFVVSDIVVQGHGENAIATGGVCRLFGLWEPEEEDLEPTEYRYTLPKGGKRLKVQIDEEE